MDFQLISAGRWDIPSCNCYTVITAKLLWCNRDFAIKKKCGNATQRCALNLFSFFKWCTCKFLIFRQSCLWRRQLEYCSRVLRYGKNTLSSYMILFYCILLFICSICTCSTGISVCLFSNMHSLNSAQSSPCYYQVGPPLAIDFIDSTRYWKRS